MRRAETASTLEQASTWAANVTATLTVTCHCAWIPLMVPVVSDWDVCIRLLAAMYVALVTRRHCFVGVTHGVKCMPVSRKVSAQVRPSPVKTGKALITMHALGTVYG